MGGPGGDGGTPGFGQVSNASMDGPVVGTADGGPGPGVGGAVRPQFAQLGARGRTGISASRAKNVSLPSRKGSERRGWRLSLAARGFVGGTYAGAGPGDFRDVPQTPDDG